jgi:hypothetical protein
VRLLFSTLSLLCIAVSKPVGEVIDEPYKSKVGLIFSGRAGDFSLIRTDVQQTAKPRFTQGANSKDVRSYCKPR